MGFSAFLIWVAWKSWKYHLIRSVILQPLHILHISTYAYSNPLVTFLGFIPKYNEPLSMSPNQRITRKNPDSSVPPGFLVILRRKKTCLVGAFLPFCFRCLEKVNNILLPNGGLMVFYQCKKIEHTPSLENIASLDIPMICCREYPSTSFYCIYVCFSFREGLDT